MQMMNSSRKYGGLISVVSGVYSLYLGMQTMNMASMWLMNILGLVVLMHGVALLTDLETDVLDRSGELMVLYSAVMLLNQVWMATMMAFDPGMTAVAVIMLGSGLIMRQQNSM
ncbi:MAG: hypothetical protein ABEJ98_04535 [Candidatus Nanohaloarchaea archaeon]